MYCQTEYMHYLLDIRKVIVTHEVDSGRYYGIKVTLIKRECMTCRQQWEEKLSQEFGTWYEIGDA